jgi:predicted SAM-dependent methyltransferase
MGKQLLKNMEGLTLDVGCGLNKDPGAIGLDIRVTPHTNVVADLSHRPYPFKPFTFAKFTCKQVLEHFNEPLKILDEMHRIAKAGALVEIEVPHFSCHYMFRSLHHKRFWSYFSLDVYIEQEKKFRYKKRKITFHRAFRRWGVQWLANKFPLSYERFWAFICPAEHLHIELIACENNS